MLIRREMQGPPTESATGRWHVGADLLKDEGASIDIRGINFGIVSKLAVVEEFFCAETNPVARASIRAEQEGFCLPGDGASRHD